MLGILISGRGSNLRSIARAVAAKEVPVSIGVVISSKPDAAGLRFAADQGVPAVVMRPSEFASRQEYDAALVATLRRYGVTLVCLAGFMRLLGKTFCDAFPDAVLNIHPSLLPSFPGTHAQRQAIEHGVKVSGATVHFVTPELDAGPIVMQTAVAVEEGDTEETLSERILQVEHELYPRALRALLGGGWTIQGRRVVFERPEPRV